MYVKVIIYQKTINVIEAMRLREERYVVLKDIRCRFNKHSGEIKRCHKLTPSKNYGHMTAAKF